MKPEEIYTACILALSISSFHHQALGIPLALAVPLFLVFTGIFWFRFRLVSQPYPTGGIVSCRGVLTMPISLLLEPERDLPGSLPLHPVLEEGFSILEANVVELGESDALQQVLGVNVVSSTLLQSRPQDSPPAATCHNPCNLYM
jgi:hypothetical protein